MIILYLCMSPLIKRFLAVNSDSFFVSRPLNFGLTIDPGSNLNAKYCAQQPVSFHMFKRVIILIAMFSNISHYCFSCCTIFFYLRSIKCLTAKERSIIKV